LGKAREGLVQRSLLAYEAPLYQVLSLPPEPVLLPFREERAKREHEKAMHFFKHIQEVLKLKLKPGPPSDTFPTSINFRGSEILRERLG